MLEADAHGRVRRVFPAQAPPTPGAPPPEDLGAVALVPGLQNAHSHAFQRALRDRTEFEPADAPGVVRPAGDFWSWRDRMYRVALALSPEEVEALSAQTFLEMARAGITAVGEFHYLHHAPDGRPYADANALAHRVIAAARRVGVRIHLLRVLYHRAGPGRIAEPEQRRFIDADVQVALGRVSDLATGWAHDPGVRVGVAPHSVRAVPGAWLRATAEFAAATDRAVHLHACEQRRELAESRAEYGAEPVAVLAEHGLLTPRTTLVHATHLDATALELLATHRPTVCACPTTERNLGDGFLPAAALLARGVPIALGSDSQARIDPWEELRLVEGHARLQAEKRNVLAAFAPIDGRARRATAAALWPMATEHGRRALAGPGEGPSVPDGPAEASTRPLAPGSVADFVSLDLHDPALLGTTADSLVTALCFSMGPQAVRGVWVGGRPIVVDGRHPEGPAIARDFLRVMARLATV